MYQLLKRTNAKWFKQAGYTAHGSSGVWWKAPDKDLMLDLLFQADKNGWSWDGNRFTLNFRLTDMREKNVPLLQCRFGKLVDGAADGDVWIALTNRIVAKLQNVKQPPLYDWELPEYRESDMEPARWFSAANDPWMRFYEEEDITMWWAEFLEPRMDSMLRRFLSLPRREL